MGYAFRYASESMSDKDHRAVYAPSYLPWLIWGLGAVFYFAGFYQRVAPAVMTDELMVDFGIGGAALGNLSAFYFYSYVAMQIPTGMLADTWGARRLLSAGAFVASLGTIFFGLAPTVLLANMGRLLIGGSVGVAWVAMLKLSAHWFPPRRFALLTGLGLCVGVAGAVSGGVPLRMLVDQFGWRPVMVISSAVTLALTLAIWFVVRDDPGQRGYASFAPEAVRGGGSSSMSVFSGLRTVLCYRNTWLLALAPSGIVGPALAFSGLWGVPFLTTLYGLTPAGSAAITSTLLVAWAVGGFVLGALSDRIGRRKPLYVCASAIAGLGWMIALYLPGMPLWVFAGLVTLVGIASGVVSTGFAFVRESVPPRLAGTASGFCNMGYMMGPMVLQPVMGWVLDHYWNGSLQGGVRIYDLHAYHCAFAPMVAWSILAIVLLAFTRETYCRQMVGESG